MPWETCPSGCCRSLVNAPALTVVTGLCEVVHTAVRTCLPPAAAPPLPTPHSSGRHREYASLLHVCFCVAVCPQRVEPCGCFIFFHKIFLMKRKLILQTSSPNLLFFCNKGPPSRPVHPCLGPLLTAQNQPFLGPVMSNVPFTLGSMADNRIKESTWEVRAPRGSRAPSPHLAPSQRRSQMHAGLTQGRNVFPAETTLVGRESTGHRTRPSCKKNATPYDRRWQGSGPISVKPSFLGLISSLLYLIGITSFTRNSYIK